jgi:O-antigen/teichoic acid export membrane protein
MRRSLRINIGANIVGRVYTAVCGVVFAPIYLHFFGIAEYGLFALLNSYMIVAALVDLGFSGAMTREIAKLSAVSPERMRDLVWTISLPYCAVGLALAIALYCASPWIASLVLSKEDSISDAAVIQAVGFAGVGLACQLPAFLFGGGLAGLQRQDISNGIAVVATTLRHGVALALLWGLSGSVVIVIAWQAAVALLSAVALLIALWAQLPSSGRRPRFQVSHLRDTGKFASSLGGMAVLGTVVMQADKTIVGALLPFAVVGHYMLASVIATNLMAIAQPVAAAAFPRLSHLIATKEWSSLRSNFSLLSQLTGLMSLPVMIVIAMLPAQTLLVWTGNAAVAQSAGPILRFLVIGTILNAFAAIPWELCIAMGRTAPLLVAAAVGCPLTLALVYFATLTFGPEGAAASMCFFPALILLTVGALLNRVLGRGELWRWLSLDVALPSVVVLALAFGMRSVAPGIEFRAQGLVFLAAAWLLCALGAGTAMGEVRVLLTRVARRSLRYAGHRYQRSPSLLGQNSDEC